MVSRASRASICSYRSMLGLPGQIPLSQEGKESLEAGQNFVATVSTSTAQVKSLIEGKVISESLCKWWWPIFVSDIDSYYSFPKIN